MQEKDLEEKFREKVKEAGGRAYKFVSPGNSGVPDRLAVLPGGKIGFVELKQRGRTPTKLQQKQMDRLRELGCCVAVLDKAEDIEGTISRIQEAGVRNGI